MSHQVQRAFALLVVLAIPLGSAGLVYAGGFGPAQGTGIGSPVTLSSTGTITWPTGLGAITHVSGPSDQPLIIDSNGTTGMVLRVGGSNRFHVLGSQILTYAALTPATDGNRDLGSSSLRWGAIYTASFVQVGAYTVATLPAATTAGRIIYVSDGAAGSPCLAFSNGTNWLRCDTLAAVSNE